MPKVEFHFEGGLPLFELIIDYPDAEETIVGLTVDEVADFIESRIQDGATGFGVYPMKEAEQDE